MGKFSFLPELSLTLEKCERKLGSSVLHIFPSAACIFNCPIFSDSSLPSFFSFAFMSFQYLRGLSVSVSTSITSMTENAYKRKYESCKEKLKLCESK